MSESVRAFQKVLLIYRIQHHSHRSLKHLEQLFAKLGNTPYAHALEPNPDIERILPGFYKLIQIKNLPDRITQLVLDGHTLNKSN